MGKADKEAKEDTGKEEMAYEAKAKFCAVIAKPLADEKLCKKVLKLCKKASKRKQIRRGVKEVVKALRKKQKGSVAVRGAGTWRGGWPLACSMMGGGQPPAVPVQSRTPACSALTCGPVPPPAGYASWLATSRPLTCSHTSPSCARTTRSPTSTCPLKT